MKVHFEDIYEQIGYLFYAMASEHGNLNAVTLDKLNRIVDQQWYPVENGQSVESHLVNYLHSGLRNAFEISMPSQVAFDHFKNYFGLHSFPFGEQLRTKIVATANTIAAEFSGNGVRSRFVSALEMLFRANPITQT